MSSINMIICMLYILLAILSIVVNAQNVIRLTSETLHQEIQIQPLLLVNYYAPWCGYCQVLSTVLDNVASQLHAQNIPAKIAVIDASADNMDQIVEDEHIDGFPTLVVYKDGQRLAEYQAHRTEKAIVDYLKLKSGPSADYIISPEDLVPYLAHLERLETFEHGLFAIIVGVFPPSNDASQESGVYGAAAQTFHEVAKVFDVAKFFYTDNPGFAKHFNIKEDSILVFSGEAHDTHHVLSFSNYKEIADIYQDLTPLVLPVSIPYTETTRATVQNLPIKQHVLCFYDVSGSDDLFLDNVLSVASKFKGKLLVIEVSSDDYSLLHYFNVRPSDLPQLVIMNMTDEEDIKRYRFVDYVANRKGYYQTHPEVVDEQKPIEAPSNQLKIKRISPSKIKEIVTTTTTASTKKPAKMPSRTGKKEEPAPLPTTTTKTIQYEEVEGEEELYYYNRQYIEAFFQEYVTSFSSAATIPQDAKEEVSVKFSERHLLSQDISVASKLNQDLVNLTPHVVNIVGAQFHEKVNMANEQDILVYFHAHWCIHCTTIEPVMTEVANFMTQDPSFVLYKIDGAKNEVVHDGVKIFAYPTIYFFPANRYLVDDFGQVQTLRKPIKYDVEEGDGIGGILSAESLITFIRKHRHHVGSTDSTEAPTEEVESEGSNSATEEEEEEVAVEEIATEEDEHVQLDHIVYENEGTEEDMQQLEEESFAEVNEDGSIFLEEKV